MLYRLLADLVVIAHLSFVIFALLGGLLCLWRKWVVLLHLPAAAWSTLLACRNWTCPLTWLENRLRQAAGSAGYAHGFVEEYLIPVLYPPGLTASTQMMLGIVVVAFNVTVYALVLRRFRRRKQGS